MAAPRRLLMGFAAVALTMVALVSASGYDSPQSAERVHVSHHRVPRSPSSIVSTVPILAQRATLPTQERRAPRATGFFLASAVLAALAVAPTSRVRRRPQDQVLVWRVTACGRRGPPVARLAA